MYNTIVAPYILWTRLYHVSIPTTSLWFFNIPAVQITPLLLSSLGSLMTIRWKFGLQKYVKRSIASLNTLTNCLWHHFCTKKFVDHRSFLTCNRCIPSTLRRPNKFDVDIQFHPNHLYSLTNITQIVRFILVMYTWRQISKLHATWTKLNIFHSSTPDTDSRMHCPHVNIHYFQQWSSLGVSFIYLWLLSVLKNLGTSLSYIHVVLIHSSVPKFLVTPNVLRLLWRQSTMHISCLQFQFHEIHPVILFLWINIFVTAS